MSEEAIKGSLPDDRKTLPRKSSLEVDTSAVDDKDTDSGLELVAHGEVSINRGNGLVFSHTTVILRRGKEHFLAKYAERKFKAKDVDLGSLELVPIPREHYCPKFEDGMTRAPDGEGYVKRPDLVMYGTLGQDLDWRTQLILQEVQVCEILKRNPHPNIVQYLGCEVDDGRITGICLKNYPSSLTEKLVDCDITQRTRYYEGVERGVRHLHQLGLVHNDLNPRNIMMDGETPVIIDFDSCLPTGEKLGLKRGTPGWQMEDVEWAREENDLYSLKKLEELIVGEGDRGLRPGQQGWKRLSDSGRNGCTRGDS